MAPAVTVTPQEMSEARGWVAAHLGRTADGKAPTPPFSFIYGGRPSAELLKDWKYEQASKALDHQRTEHTLLWTDPVTGLSVRCRAVEYLDFPTVEWTLHLKNTGGADTPIVENIQALELRLLRANRANSPCTITWAARPRQTTISRCKPSWGPRGANAWPARRENQPAAIGRISTWNGPARA